MILSNGLINRKVWLVFFMNLFVSLVIAQDTATKKVQLDIKAELWGSQIFEPLNAGVRMPENIRNRRSSSVTAPPDFYSITDNPLKHGAYYGCIKTTTSFSAVFW